MRNNYTDLKNFVVLNYFFFFFSINADGNDGAEVGVLFKPQ